MEGLNISLGRGTTKPFEYIGAPWIEPYAFCKGLESLGLKNFKFKPVYFIPTFSTYAGMKCGGAQIFYVGGKFSPTMVSYRISRYILANYRGFAAWSNHGNDYNIDHLAGTDIFRLAVDSGKEYGEFEKDISAGIKDFMKKRKKYLLY